MEATKVSIHRQMNKKAVVHIYYGILLSHKRNTFESVLTRWMNLEPIIQSKSEREKQIMYTNTYIWNLERWYWWTYLQNSNRDTDVENRLVDIVGEGESGTNWESIMETYMLPYIKYIPSLYLSYDRGSSNRCSVTTQMDGMDGKWERGSRGKRHIYTYGWFMLMCGRNQHNIIKQLWFFQSSCMDVRVGI